MTGSHQEKPERRERRAEPRQGRGRRAALGRRRKRRRGRLLLATATPLLVLVTAGAGWLYLKLDSNIETFGADGVSDDRPSASKGENVLVIGSDGRTAGNSDLGGGNEHDIGRSDTAFLLHIYADHQHAVAVSIPRDTLVTIPPCKLPDGSWTKAQTNTMFNAAYSMGEAAKGNPACTQNTVEKLTGLRVDHTVVVDFKGFSKLTDVVDGVQVCLPQDVYQKDLNPHRASRGKLLFSKGEQTLAGQKALDYVRIRHGIGDGSDIGRIKRQQAFISSLLKKVQSEGFTPTKLLPLADAAVQSLTVDPGLGSADKLLAFAMSMKDIDLHDTTFVTLPWRYDGNRVAVVQPDADALWTALKADRTLDGKDASGDNRDTDTSVSASPSDTGKVAGDGIIVAVHNGTATSHLASRAAKTLTDHDFTVTGTANAPAQDHATTVIEYGPGQKAEAETAARLFSGAQLKSTRTPGINVVVGEDYARGSSASAEPTTVPTSVADNARSADEDICSHLSYG